MDILILRYRIFYKIKGFCFMELSLNLNNENMKLVVIVSNSYVLLYEDL